MEDITGGGNTHTKRVCEDFEIKSLVQYHDLYVESGALLLADTFSNCSNICVEIHGLDPAHPGKQLQERPK